MRRSAVPLVVLVVVAGWVAATSSGEPGPVTIMGMRPGGSWAPLEVLGPLRYSESIFEICGQAHLRGYGPDLRSPFVVLEYLRKDLRTVEGPRLECGGRLVAVPGTPRSVVEDSLGPPDSEVRHHGDAAHAFYAGGGVGVAYRRDRFLRAWFGERCPSWDWGIPATALPR